MCEIRNYTLNSFGLFFHPYLRYVPLYGIILFHIDCHNNIPRHDSDEFFPLTHTQNNYINYMWLCLCFQSFIQMFNNCLPLYDYYLFLFLRYVGFYGIWNRYQRKNNNNVTIVSTIRLAICGKHLSSQHNLTFLYDE